MAAAVYHVRFTCAADYNARRLPFRPAHLAQLTALRDDGRVVAGGPEPDGGAAHIFYRVADRAALDALIAANEFQRAGLFVAHAARVFDDFVEPSERLPHDAGWSVTLVEGVPADRARARAALTRLSTDKLVNLGGFFADGRALAVVREPDAAAAVARLVTAGGWDAARLTARPWSQTL
jgi:uncharacterized protein